MPLYAFRIFPLLDFRRWRRFHRGFRRRYGGAFSGRPRECAGAVRAVRADLRLDVFHPGLALVVDGATVCRHNPSIGRWEHPYARCCDSSVLAADTRLLFGRWTDNGARSHRITVAGAIPYTASYVRHFRVTNTANQWGPERSISALHLPMDSTRIVR